MSNFFKRALDEKKLHLTALFFICAYFFVSRFYLLQQVSINSDDGWHLMHGLKPTFLQVLENVWRENVHPPLYFLFLHLLSNVSKDVIFLRITSSLLPATISIIIAYFIGKKVLDKNYGLILAVIFASLSCMQILSLTIRQYCLMVMFLLLMIYAGLKLFENFKSKKWQAIYFLSCFCSVFLYYSAAFVVFIFAITLSLYWYRYKKNVPLKSCIVFFFIHFLIGCLLVANYFQYYYVKNDLSWHFQNYFPAALNIHKVLFKQIGYLFNTNWIVPIFIIIAFTAFYFKKIKNYRLNFSLLLAFSILLFGFIFLLHIFKIYPLTASRHSIALIFFYYPIFALFLYYLISFLKTQRKKFTAVVALFLIFNLSNPTIFAYSDDFFLSKKEYGQMKEKFEDFFKDKKQNSVLLLNMASYLVLKHDEDWKNEKSINEDMVQATFMGVKVIADKFGTLAYRDKNNEVSPWMFLDKKSFNMLYLQANKQYKNKNYYSLLMFFPAISLNEFKETNEKNKTLIFYGESKFSIHERTKKPYIQYTLVKLPKNNFKQYLDRVM